MNKANKKANPTATKAEAAVTHRPAPAKSKTVPTHDVQDDAIRFYRANEKPYGAFSNLYPRQIEFEGRAYPTSEHAYQAGKASKPAVREWILNAPSPSLAAMAAHGLYVWDVVPNWSQIKFDRMRAVLRAKFDQHADLKELLLSTGSTRLVETGTVSNAVNRLWGEVDGKGGEHTRHHADGTALGIREAKGEARHCGPSNGRREEDCGLEALAGHCIAIKAVL